MRSAFFDTAVTLFGVFDLYDAPAPLREATAEALARVVREHLWPRGGAPAALHDLMTELELAMRAGEEENE